MKMQKKLLAHLISSALLFSGGASAAWSSDPSQNLQTGTNGSVLKLAKDSQGNIFLTYMTSDSGFDVLLQKFDANGNKDSAWGDEPILVADRDQSWTESQSITTDEQGNIYVAYRKDLKTSDDPWDPAYNIAIEKISPDGQKVWPEAKMYLADDKVKQRHAPYLSYADGRLFMAWEAELDTYVVESRVAQLDLDGNLLASSKEKFIERNLNLVNITAVADGVVVFYWGASDEVNGSNLYAQKYDLQGKPVWGDTPSAVTEGQFWGPKWGYPTIELHSDGEGGVYFGWRQVTSFGGDAYLQHIKSDGKYTFPRPGLRLSDSDAFYDTVMHSVSRIGTNYYVTWAGLSDRNTTGLFTQKVSAKGELLWGDKPLEIAPEKEFTASFAGYEAGAHVATENGILISYNEGTADYGYKIVKQVSVSPSGQVGVSSEIVSTPAVMGNVQVIQSIYGEMIMAWTTGWWGDGPIFMQNVHQDGSLGVSDNILLEYKPELFEKENTQATIDLHYLDNNSESHSISVNSQSQNAQIELVEQQAGKLTLNITPENEFSGKVPFTVTLQDDNDVYRDIEKIIEIDFVQVNNFPVIETMAPLTANEGDNFTYSATVTDSDSSDITISWRQISGSAVELSGSDETLAFITPHVAQAEELTFELTASDGVSQTTQSITVSLANDKVPTIAANDISVAEASNVTLSPEISGAKLPLSYQWTQLSGPVLTMDPLETGDLKVTVPFTDGNSAASVQLEITDANGETAIQSFNIAIADQTESEVPETTKKSGGPLSPLILMWASLALFARTRFFNKKNN